MIGNPRDTLHVAYVFPRKYAIEYLNLRTHVVPAMNDQIAGLRNEIRLRELTIEGRDTVIASREGEARALRGGLLKSDSIVAERERELRQSLRRERLYRKLLVYGLPAGCGLGVLLGLALTN